MAIIFLQLGKFLMRIIYFMLKLFPTTKKVVFLSRQYNEPSIDFIMLEAEILRRDPTVKIVMICERIEATAVVGNKRETPLLVVGFRLFYNTLRSMYHVATSRVAVLDTYSPIISLLNHKPTLTVIQIWHAMGKIKQSGYRNLDTEGGGRSSRVAKAMNMHQGYDIIVAGAAAWNQFYCESFNVEEDVLYNVGLPRIDYILQNRDSLRERILKKHDGLGAKPVVIYAPTWRKTGIDGWDSFIDQFDFDQFNLIVKSHPNQELAMPTSKIYTIADFSTLECLAIADYLVTDYSATAVEAAALDVKTYYYLYDYEVYVKKNGLNIDLFTEMAGCVFEDASDLIKALEAEYPVDSFEGYKAKFLPETIGQSTDLITDKIMERL